MFGLASSHHNCQALLCKSSVGSNTTAGSGELIVFEYSQWGLGMRLIVCMVGVYSLVQQRFPIHKASGATWNYSPLVALLPGPT